MSKKVLVYDCEVINNPTQVGWDNFTELGVSVIGCHASWRDMPLVAYDARSQSYLSDFQILVDQAEVIVGFNSISFDDKLLRENGVYITTTVDLLCEVRVLSGQPRFFSRGITRSGYNLGAICAANGLGMKTGHGADAPLLWQAGQYDEVIQYCLNDVRMTRRLYEKWLQGDITDPTTGEAIRPLSSLSFDGLDW